MKLAWGFQAWEALTYCDWHKDDTSKLEKNH